MARPAPRLNRFPQRLDYTLVPAPLDLSLPDVTEKSPLPAIIVTPSSPSHTHAPDYFIAFLAPPPPPTLRERLAAKWKGLRCESETGPVALPPTPSSPTTHTRPASRGARTVLLASVLALVLLCHVVSHGILQRRHMEFTPATEGAKDMIVEDGHPHHHAHHHHHHQHHDGGHKHGGEDMHDAAFAHHQHQYDDTDVDAPAGDSWFGWLQPVWAHGERGADFVVKEEELAEVDVGDAIEVEVETHEVELEVGDVEVEAELD
ncbi:hypothetical protein BD626DRAFT_534560 [Schizophyllum amplum]|uniref:Uncharacterized protein n=1 Tax=Schizophyllum amplum TaxID=97359 RepID=A0A550CUV8_9AGAR|nr:hypothetical protein BD626DRAFT_534560 [Auriculariopsis ampla]